MASDLRPAGQTPTEVRSAQTFDGARLEYEVAGSGPSLVMLHGVLASRRTFSRQLAAFSERFRLIMLSARGHDGSEMKLPPNYGAGSSDVDDLRAVLEAENIDRVSLVGHSSGGATAFVFASRYPDRMARMVLIEPTLLGISLPAESEKVRSIFEGSGLSLRG